MAKVTLSIESTTQDIAQTTTNVARQIRRMISRSDLNEFLAHFASLIGGRAGFQVFRREDFERERDRKQGETPQEADAPSQAENASSV